MFAWLQSMHKPIWCQNNVLAMTFMICFCTFIVFQTPLHLHTPSYLTQMSTGHLVSIKEFCPIPVGSNTIGGEHLTVHNANSGVKSLLLFPNLSNESFFDLSDSTLFYTEAVAPSHPPPVTPRDFTSEFVVLKDYSPESLI